MPFKAASRLWGSEVKLSTDKPLQGFYCEAATGSVSYLSQSSVTNYSRVYYKIWTNSGAFIWDELHATGASLFWLTSNMSSRWEKHLLRRQTALENHSPRVHITSSDHFNQIQIHPWESAFLHIYTSNRRLRESVAASFFGSFKARWPRSCIKRHQHCCKIGEKYIVGEERGGQKDNANIFVLGDSEDLLHISWEKKIMSIRVWGGGMRYCNFRESQRDIEGHVL